MKQQERLQERYDIIDVPRKIMIAFRKIFVISTVLSVVSVVILYVLSPVHAFTIPTVNRRGITTRSDCVRRSIVNCGEKTYTSRALSLHELSGKSSLAKGDISSPSSSSTKYIRIQPRTVQRGNRRIFELQTAVATFSKTQVVPNNNNNTSASSQIISSSIDLHSMLHFAEQQYFQFYNDGQQQQNELSFGLSQHNNDNNDMSISRPYDKVFYELILSQNLLTAQPDGTRILSPPTNTDTNTPDYKPMSVLAPPPSDVATANSYNLACQINVVDYTQSNWIHCDVTREQFQYMANGNESNNNSNNGDSDDLKDMINNELASIISEVGSIISTATSPIRQYTSALFRPTTPSSYTNPTTPSNDQNVSRLFTNLFLPGRSFATLLRLLLWPFSPCPEVSILLLDWSSLIDPKPTGTISSIFLPVVECLLAGNILEARRLVFAQLLVGGQTVGERESLLVTRRNDVALKILMDSIQGEEEEIREMMANNDAKVKDSINNGCDEKNYNYALLYGAMHCQDLQSQLESMGYRLTNFKWRSAWSVTVPSLGNRDILFLKDDDTDGAMSIVGLLVVPLYLLVGGLDWIGTVQDIANLLDARLWGDSIAIEIFYLLRHVALYLGLAKFVVDWDGEDVLFGSERNNVTR